MSTLDEYTELLKGTPPRWADGWGHDDAFGGFVEIWLDKVVRQRFRWIPPGDFTMGSAESEEGHFPDESPEHQARVSRGFWLSDTPCTQEMWQQVMGSNPSDFKSPTRPVEQVSYDDVAEFLRRLNDTKGETLFRLPNEAEWEFACRAGTSTSTYAGDLTILGKRNAPLLDDIAWYSGNSGVDFELTNGYDGRRWRERQYPDAPCGTHPVGRKTPNPWGVYDMLGNVYEWCSDAWGYYLRETSVRDDQRVVRGGSWLDIAGVVRAAYRYGHPTDYRYRSLGFRICASGSSV